MGGMNYDKPQKILISVNDEKKVFFLICQRHPTMYRNANTFCMEIENISFKKLSCTLVNAHFDDFQCFRGVVWATSASPVDHDLPVLIFSQWINFQRAPRAPSVVWRSAIGGNYGILSDIIVAEFSIFPNWLIAINYFQIAIKNSALCQQYLSVLELLLIYPGFSIEYA